MQETWVLFRVGKIPWRRERLPTPVFWPEEVHGLYSPWGHKESDTTGQLSLSGNQGMDDAWTVTWETTIILLL